MRDEYGSNVYNPSLPFHYPPSLLLVGKGMELSPLALYLENFLPSIFSFPDSTYTLTTPDTSFRHLFDEQTTSVISPSLSLPLSPNGSS